MNRSSWLVLALTALLSGCREDTPGADAPNPLSFITPEHSVVAGECSLAVTLEAQTPEGDARPVVVPVTVELEAEPMGSAVFYRDAACTARITSAELPLGTSRATVFFRSTQAPSVSLGATAAGFTPARQTHAVRAAAPASAVFLGEYQTLPTSGCSARVDVELRDAYDNPAPSDTPRSLTFTGSSRGLSFYSDATCTTAITDAPFAATASATSFHYKSTTSELASVVINPSGLPPARQEAQILPIVRNRACELSEQDTSVICRILPAQVDPAKTMLFYQAGTSEPLPASSMVRCSLSGPDTLTCSRNTAGRSVTIRWGTVELARGLRVQHLRPECSTPTTTLEVPIDPVSPDNTFLLVGSENDRTVLDEKNFFTAKLKSPTRVELQFSTACGTAWKGALQVVQWDGARVIRGSDALTTGQGHVAIGGLPSTDLSTTAMLFTHRVSRTSTPNTCDRGLRGEVSSPHKVSFWRAGGYPAPACATASVDEISWERIDFGALARVQPLLFTFEPGTLGMNLTLPGAVDSERTVVFSGSQTLNGQSGGESTSAEEGALGEMLVEMQLYSSSQLGLRREHGRGTTRVNAFAVQFEP